MTAADDKRPDREAFEREMAGVKRLASDKPRVTPAKRRPVPPRARAAPPGGVAFLREGSGEDAGFRAPDVGRDVLRRLRRGEIEPDLELDLHGHDEVSACRETEQAVREAAAEGLRALRIVHGRGKHSLGPAVLRDAVLACLQRPPLAALVAALAPAPQRQGGAGATHVLLRRPRSGMRS